jgi:hypothetical protein
MQVFAGKTTISTAINPPPAACRKGRINKLIPPAISAMTDEQLKTLAELTLLNDERLRVLSATLNNLIARVVEAGNFPERASILQISSEHSQALSNDAEGVSERLRKVWGLGG